MLLLLVLLLMLMWVVLRQGTRQMWRVGGHRGQDREWAAQVVPQRERGLGHLHAAVLLETRGGGMECKVDSRRGQVGRGRAAWESPLRRDGRGVEQVQAPGLGKGPGCPRVGRERPFSAKLLTCFGDAGAAAAFRTRITTVFTKTCCGDVFDGAVCVVDEGGTLVDVNGVTFAGAVEEPATIATLIALVRWAAFSVEDLSAF